MDELADSRIFPYQPNKIAPLVFAAAFSLSLAVHIFQAYKARAKFMLVLIFATAFQILGYLCRKIAAENGSSGIFIVSQTCIVAAPSFSAAQDYMIIGRMMSYVGSESTFISHSIVTKLFVFIDIVCVLTQSTGIAMLTMGSGGPDSMSTGRGILIFGLFLQIASFVIFLFIAILFDRKSLSLHRDKIELKRLRPLFTAFYISAVLIIGRCVYRAIEFTMMDFAHLDDDYLFTHEWPIYALDGFPILIATVVFNICNPAWYLPRKKGLRMDGSQEGTRKHWWSRVKTAQSQEHMMEGGR
ncbi:hypothetical protein FRC16_003718 [Serendipita sp. 398]|nr:hypothetical protein FRC16_003718 [Serendipita sp. 398]